MKKDFILLSIFVIAVGLIAAYMFAVQKGYAFSRLLDTDYSIAYLGLVVNEGNAVAGLIVPNGTVTIGSGTAGTEKLNVTGTISATEMKIGAQNVCRADGTNCPAAPAQAPHGKQRFTSPGTFTVPAGVTKVWVSMSGGGGGGSSGKKYSDGSTYIDGGGGGGAHAVLAEEVTVTPGENIAVTIGTGGAGGSGITVVPNGTGSDHGGDGGTSLFGGYISTPGGKGNTMNPYDSDSATSGGSGGTRGSFSLIYHLNVGDNGNGGSSIFGAGGSYGVTIANTTTFQGSPGEPGAGFGGGGGGGKPNRNITMKGGTSGNGTLGGAGGAGAPGFVLVEW